MAEVSFYILPTASQHERYLFACKLVEKAYRSSGQPCYVLTDSDAQSGRLDDLLWTFRAGSFIPHQRYQQGEPVTPLQKVLIGSSPAPQGWQHTLINVSAQFPQARHIIEILDNSESSKAAGRTRFRQYQQAGDSITTYKQTPTGQWEKVLAQKNTESSV
ncbi:MAG: DNA polymerase III subunit chi [Methylococcaceae bacterium]